MKTEIGYALEKIINNVKQVTTPVKNINISLFSLKSLSAILKLLTI